LIMPYERDGCIFVCDMPGRKPIIATDRHLG
jgi:hypothetical protein